VALNPFSLLENVSLRVPPGNLRDFSLFGVCPCNKHCPSARCAYAANAVSKDLDIFVSEPFLSVINLKLLISFVHNPTVLLPLIYVCLFTFLY
jgi:hypothetical protein